MSNGKQQITTHILDTARGQPADGVNLSLFQQDGERWTELGGGTTNNDGRVPNLLPADLTLPAGTYRMHFATADYFEGRGESVFYPWVDVVFKLDGKGDHYHIPLLLAPFGYSTYRGS